MTLATMISRALRRVSVSSGLALALGALHALSFAPWPSAWLQVGCLTAMLMLWRRLPAALPRVGRGLVAGAFGLGWFATGLCWLYVSMHDHGGLPAPLAAAAVLLFAAYLAIYPAAALCWAGRAPAGRPLMGALRFAGAWTLAEWLRGVAFTGFPWLAAGYAHVDSPLAGFAPLLGVYGVTGLAAFAAACLAGVLDGFAADTREPIVSNGGHQRGGPWHLAGSHAWTMIALAALWVCGAMLSRVNWTQPAGEPILVRLLQGNVPQSMKFDPHTARRSMAMYADMALAGRADLTVMPETAWTVPWQNTPSEIAERLLGAARAQDGPAGAIAIGMPLLAATPPGTNRSPMATPTYPALANSVLLLTPGQSPSLEVPGTRYDKRHLVPFGEFVPPLFAWFVRMMNIPLGDFARGTDAQPPFEVAGQRLAFNICYEDLFGEELLTQVRAPSNATILVNVSNIGWFGHSHALPQHLAIARMRAIETARPMLRATNTGMTASIDARGQVRRQLPAFSVGALEDRVQGMTGLTPYARLGNAAALLLAALSVVVTLHRGRTR